MDIVGYQTIAEPGRPVCIGHYWLDPDEPIKPQSPLGALRGSDGDVFRCLQSMLEPKRLFENALATTFFGGWMAGRDVIPTGCRDQVGWTSHVDPGHPSAA